MATASYGTASSGGSGGGSGGGTVTVANAAALGALDASGYSEGQGAYVQTFKEVFDLELTSATAVTNLVIAASGKAGYAWVRRLKRNPTWEAQATWAVDPQNSSGLASDENTGVDITHPLVSYTEQARRLENAIISQNTDTTVMSNNQATDLPVYSCVCKTGIVMSFTGTLTAVYSGTATTFTAAAAAPAADDEEIADTGVPVSFTASGMLATAILFKRTNSTAAYWWAAKDLGTKTIRVSRATTVTGRIEVVLATNDTYTAYSMPKLGPLRFSLIQRNDAVVVQFCEDVSAVADIQTRPISYTLCWHSGSSNFNYGSVHNNCAWSGSMVFRGFNLTAATAFSFGLVKGVTITIGAGAMIQWAGRVTLQAGRINANGGADLQFVGDLAIYDRTTSAALTADYWSFIFFQNGAISGIAAGNTAALMISAVKWSSISYMAAALCIAASFNSATPLAVGTTAIAVATLPDNLNATLGIGIYKTE